MTEAAQADNERPRENLGRFVGLVRITKPDGSSRDVEIEADIKPSMISGRSIEDRPLPPTLHEG